MKNILITSLIILLSVNLLGQKNLFRIGPYAGYYTPSDELFNEYYQTKDIVFGLNTGVKIWKGIHAYAFFYQYELISKTTITEEISRLKMIPISFGARYEYQYKFLRPFVGIGYTMVLFTEINAIEPEGKKDIASGLNFNLGCGFQISEHFMIQVSIMKSDAFYKNEIDPAEGKIETINIGAFQMGVSFIVMIF